MVVCETTEKILEALKKEYGDEYDDEELIEMIDDFDISDYTKF